MRSSTTGGQAVRRLSSSSSTVGHRSSSQRESMPSSIHTATRASMSQGRQPAADLVAYTLHSQSVGQGAGRLHQLAGLDSLAPADRHLHGGMEGDGGRPAQLGMTAPGGGEHVAEPDGVEQGGRGGRGGSGARAHRPEQAVEDQPSSGASVITRPSSPRRRLATLPSRSSRTRLGTRFGDSSDPVGTSSRYP